MPFYTRDRIVTAMNTATDDIVEAADLPDEGARDALNLLVNVAIERLDRPDVSVDTVIAENYQAEPGEVLSWLVR